MERPDVSYEYEYTGVLCGVARWGKTLKRESRSAQEEAADYEEAPLRTGVQPDVESIRDDAEEVKQAEHEFCERDTEGAGEPANPIDGGVMMQSLIGAGYGAVWALPHF